MALTIFLLCKKGTLSRKQEFHFNSQTLHAFPCPCHLPPPLQPPPPPCKSHPFPQSTSVAISSRRLVACSADRVSFRSLPRSTVRSAITTATSSSIWLHPWKKRQLSHLIFPFPLKHIEK